MSGQTFSVILKKFEMFSDVISCILYKKVWDYRMQEIAEDWSTAYNL